MNGDSAFGESGLFGEKGDEGFVGFSVEGWRLDTDFEDVVFPRYDLVAGGVGSYFYGEKRGVLVVGLRHWRFL